MKTVCVLIPTYNSEKTIKECVESIQRSAQKADTNAYIYVFDNCSKDKTRAIINLLKAENLISGYYLRPRNIGFGTFLHMATWHEKNHCMRHGWTPAIFMDSEDIVSEDYFIELKNTLLLERQSNIDMIISNYKLLLVNSQSSHNHIGTNSFYRNAQLLSKKRRALASLLLPGACGYTSIIWGTCFVTYEAFQTFKCHTRKFILRPEIPIIAWENTLPCWLLYLHEYTVSSGILLRGCTKEKYIAFHGSDSALAALIYNEGQNGLEKLDCYQQYEIIPNSLKNHLNTLRTIQLHQWELMRQP